MPILQECLHSYNYRFAQGDPAGQGRCKRPTGVALTGPGGLCYLIQGAAL